MLYYKLTKKPRANVNSIMSQDGSIVLDIIQNKIYGIEIIREVDSVNFSFDDSSFTIKIEGLNKITINSDLVLIEFKEINKINFLKFKIEDCY